ncbi:hypothetical protein GALL_54220 [mine drainage metagenome]|uniref:Uncharacterized protein n=1 Tax=mine drainage metagenome TaxID=410659 RepID=A0A1J5T087_9ZZZZ
MVQRKAQGAAAGESIVMANVVAAIAPQDCAFLVAGLIP